MNGVGRTYAELSSGRGVSEEIDARAGPDERDLDAVERSGVSEDDLAFREIHRARCEEFDVISGEAQDIVCNVSDLER